MAITRNAASADKDAVYFAINGGGPSGFQPLADGDTCNIPIGTVTWPSTVLTGVPAGPIVVNKNITIKGDGIGRTVITGGALFLLHPQPGAIPRLTISDMTWIRNSSADPTLDINGVAVIDEAHMSDSALSGGFRVSRIYQLAANDASQDGRNWNFRGWLEGVVDHCIVEYTIIGGQGEAFIINHNGTPTNPVGSGYYSWSVPYTLNDWQQIFVEDCIFKKRGMLDANQDSSGTAGGARFTVRHCLSWGETSNHESRADGAKNIIGPRSLHCYKNIYRRDNSDPNLSGRFVSCRQGEVVSWGNRFELFGQPFGQQVSNMHHVLQNYQISAWIGNAVSNTKNGWGGPDGANEWDLNCFGTIDPWSGGRGGSFSPVDGANGNAGSGSIYAQGHGATTSGHTITLTGMSNQPTDRWQGFVIRKVTPGTVRDLENPISYGFIASNDNQSPTHFTMKTGNENTAPIIFSIGASDDWEIRRVNQYFCPTGSGTLHTENVNSGVQPTFNPAFTAPYLDVNHIRYNDAAGRRWIGQDQPGCTKWDNKYRVSNDPTTFTDDDVWGGSNTFYGSIPNIRNTVGHPGYFYLNDGSTPTLPGNFSGATEVRPDTRVGPDQQVWSLASNALKTFPGVHSGTTASDGSANPLLYTAGIGGPTYPHPFVASVPTITSPSTATFVSGHAVDCASNPKANCHTITTFGFSGTPTITVSWLPTTPPNVTFDGVNKISGTGAGVLTQSTYGATINATYAVPNPDEVATQSFILTITPANVPPTNVTLSVTGVPFSAPATVHLSATASDSDGSIATIQYYQGGSTLIQTINAALIPPPYAYDWTGVGLGTYSLTVKATDNFGDSTTSAPVIVTVLPATTLPAPTIVVTSQSLPPPVIAPVITSSLTANATAGTPFSYQIIASNAPVSYSATGLPSGLTVSTATGLISGTPITAAATNVTIGATNSAGIGTATLVITVAAAPPSGNKMILHWQATNNNRVSAVATNHTYIDTLPFDGIVVSTNSNQDLLGPTSVVNYTTLTSEISPMNGLLSNVRHNYFVVMPGNSGMQDPFDSWTQTIQNFVLIARVCKEQGLEGIFFDNEEYGVHWWTYPTDVAHAASHTLAAYQAEWRQRGKDVIAAMISEWPAIKILHTIAPSRSVNSAPFSGAFSGSASWLGGYFFMGMFEQVPTGNHVISGGEIYYLRTATHFSTEKSFHDTIYTQNAALLTPSFNASWLANDDLSWGIYDQDSGNPVNGGVAMTPTILQTTLQNGVPNADEFVWNYSESGLEWLNPATPPSAWITAVQNARITLGI